MQAASKHQTQTTLIRIEKSPLSYLLWQPQAKIPELSASTEHEMTTPLSSTTNSYAYSLLFSVGVFFASSLAAPFLLGALAVQ